MSCYWSPPEGGSDSASPSPGGFVNGVFCSFDSESAELSLEDVNGSFTSPEAHLASTPVSLSSPPSILKGNSIVSEGEEGDHHEKLLSPKKRVSIVCKEHLLHEAKRTRIEPGSLFDSHCHYDFLLNKLNLTSYKDYCKKYPKGDFRRDYMGGIITNFCDPLTWGNYSDDIPLMEELKQDPRIYFAFGCHPRFACHFNDSHLAKLEKLIQTERVVALGEIGLDFANINGKSTSPRDVQISIFYEQLLLAKRYNKPLVLHVRDAEEETIEVLKKAGIPPDYNIHRHCMIDSWEVANRWLTEFPGSVIGITNIVTRPDVPHVHQLVQSIPLDHIVLETDAPYFYPYHVLKRKSNHQVSYPMLAIHVAEKIVELRNKESLRDFILAIKRNVERVYRLNEVKEPMVESKFRDVASQTMTKEEYVYSFCTSSDEEISDYDDEDCEKEEEEEEEEGSVS